jgi:alpha-L-fucosidase
MVTRLLDTRSSVAPCLRVSWIAYVLILSHPLTLFSQAPYVPPSDPVVAEKLEQWQDLKFGLLMHWGPYSQWGVVESWSICPEDEDWCRRRPEHGTTYNEYVKNYEALQTTFNPVKFDPAKWARAAKEAGMKYMVFTTKHHDGFCMFDTRTTDYRITSPNTPFHDDSLRGERDQGDLRPRSVQEGLWTGAYFSKPDWHSPDYWWRYFPAKDRSVNYLPTKHPERWQAFKDHTYAQIEELMTGYGPVDILWLDGGWVRPFNSIDTSVSWQKAITIEQDIEMPRIAAMARTHQPGLAGCGPYRGRRVRELHNARRACACYRIRACRGRPACRWARAGAGCRTNSTRAPTRSSARW